MRPCTSKRRLTSEAVTCGPGFTYNVWSIHFEVTCGLCLQLPHRCCPSAQLPPLPFAVAHVSCASRSSQQCTCAASRETLIYSFLRAVSTYQCRLMRENSFVIFKPIQSHPLTSNAPLQRGFFTGCAGAVFGVHMTTGFSFRTNRKLRFKIERRRTMPASMPNDPTSQNTGVKRKHWKATFPPDLAERSERQKRTLSRSLANLHTRGVRACMRALARRSGGLFSRLLRPDKQRLFASGKE